MQAKCTTNGAPANTRNQYVQVVSLRLVKEGSMPWDGVSLTSPGAVYSFVRDVLAELDREHLGMIALNTKKKVTGYHTVAIGTLNATPIAGREIFKAAILMNAASIVLVHNHPSGDPEPSADDVRMTREMTTVGQMLDINVLDHIVVGDGRYVSLRERGML